MFKKFLFKQIAIILVMALIGGTGIISCGQDTTQPSSSQEEAPAPDKTGPETPDTDTDIDEEPAKPNFDANSYITVYTPWRGENYPSVSWQDTNTLTEMWKEMIGRKIDEKRWFIRDGDNHLNYDFIYGNYYYFDKNFDIVHMGSYAGKTKVKQFLGGVIVKYSGGSYSGTWTIGGLYRWLFNKSKDNSEGKLGYTKYENDNFNEFMRAIHDWNEGDLSVILMNIGYTDKNFDQFGVDEYYCTIDDSYRQKPESFLGQNPTNYLGTDKNGWNGEKLNVRVNHSWNLPKFNFRFISRVPYEWHLE